MWENGKLDFIQMSSITRFLCPILAFSLILVKSEIYVHNIAAHPTQSRWWQITAVIDVIYNLWLPSYTYYITIISFISVLLILFIIVGIIIIIVINFMNKVGYINKIEVNLFKLAISSCWSACAAWMLQRQLHRHLTFNCTFHSIPFRFFRRNYYKHITFASTYSRLSDLLLLIKRSI